MPKEEFKPRSPWYRKIIYLLVIITIVYGLYHYGFIKKNCEQDKECFYEAAKNCKPAKLTNIKGGHYYYYAIKGQRGDNCLIYVKLERMAVGTAVLQKELFEGKDMSCRVPLDTLEETNFAELKGFVNHCHGTLKEAIYEQIITKMYGLIIQNMEEIIAAGTEEIT